MGTNYYMERQRCPHCGLKNQQLHLGKQSHGWRFTIRGYSADNAFGWIPGDDFNVPPYAPYARDREVHSLDDMYRLIMRMISMGWYLVDEYGTELPPRKFILLVLSTANARSHYDYLKDSAQLSGSDALDDRWFTVIYTEFS